MKLIFLTIFFAFLIPIYSSAQSPDSKQPEGKLSGLIIDKYKTRVPKVKLIVEGNNFSREIESNDYGYYEIWLAKGKYKIRISEKNKWYVTTRKQFSIIPKKAFRYNFVLKDLVVIPPHESDLKKVDLKRSIIE